MEEKRFGGGVGRREWKFTEGLLWACPCPVPARVPACRPHAACQLPSHNAAALPPAGPATYCIQPPSPPGSIVPVRPLAAHRFRIAGRGEDDPHILRSIHVPVGRVPPVHAQSAGSVPPLARSVRSVGSSASGARDESPESIPGRTPTSPINLRPTSATLRRSRDKPSVSVRAFAFGVADVPAADAAPVSRSQPAGKILQRSEEHTSELQSHLNLLCRLL